MTIHLLSDYNWSLGMEHVSVSCLVKVEYLILTEYVILAVTMHPIYPYLRSIIDTHTKAILSPMFRLCPEG